MDKEAEFRHTLQSLGLGIYADHLIAEAFDSWEVLAQITEDDLFVSCRKLLDAD